MRDIISLRPAAEKVPMGRKKENRKKVVTNVQNFITWGS